MKSTILNFLILFCIAIASLSIDSDNTVKYVNSGPSSSLLIILDVSGSMNDDNKLIAAKRAAEQAIGRLEYSKSVEIALLSFSGGCSDPTNKYIEFTTNYSEIRRGIAHLIASGGTPLSTTISQANQILSQDASTRLKDRMILLLADGDDDCGNLINTINRLKASNIVFRHETIGLGIDPYSRAAEDLRILANATGGKYHYATDHSQLADVFENALQTMDLLDLLGTMGGKPSIRKKDVDSLSVRWNILKKN